MSKLSLAKWLNNLQQEGQYSFTREEALSVLKCSEQGLSVSIGRLVHKKRIMNIRTGFYVIVPFEYSYHGILPPTWFINPLMKYLHRDYYVGLLSAASFYGAAHQAPQVFQVITDRTLKEVSFKNLNIRFYKNKHIGKVPTEQRMTETGYIQVATPAVVALDLVKYQQESGGLSNVAMVLSELMESMNIRFLTDIIKSGLYESTIVQRLGFILQSLDEKGAKYAEAIYNASNNIYRFKNTVLDIQSPIKNGRLDPKWHVIVNETLEMDL